MTDRPTDVRIGIKQDEDAIWHLCQTIHAECAFGGDLDEGMVRLAVGPALAREKGIVGIIDGDNGEIAGAVVLKLTPWWYGPSLHWEDLFFYVAPQYRNGKRDQSLMAFCKWWTEQINDTGLEIPLVVGVFQEGRAEAKTRLWRKNFRQVGGLFVYGPTARGMMGASDVQ